MSETINELNGCIQYTDVIRDYSATTQQERAIMDNQVAIMKALKELLEEKDKPTFGPA